MKTTFLFAILSVAFCVNLKAAWEGFEKDGKWGMIDENGAVVIEPKYESLGTFQEGLAPAADNGKWGFVDKTGKWVITPLFDDYNYFNGGHAYVKYRGLWTQIDINGKIAKPSKLADLYAASKTGELGLLFLRGKVGYASADLAKIIKPRFDDAGPFAQDRAPASLDGKWGLIDTSGTFVAEPGYDMAFMCREDFCPVLKDGKWGFLGLDGKLAVKNEFDEVELFSEGMAPVKKDLKWGYIDRSGKMVVEPKFSEAHAFSGGKAINFIESQASAGVFLLKRVNAVAWLNPDGTGIIPVGSSVPYAGLGITFDNSGKYGLMLGTATVIPAEYDELGGYGSGYLVYKKNGKYGYVSAAGTVLTPPDFEDASAFSCGSARVRSAGKYGIFSDSGAWLVPAEYAYIELNVCSGGIHASMAGKNGFILPGRYFIPGTGDWVIQQPADNMPVSGVSAAGRAAAPQVPASKMVPTKAADLIEFRFAVKGALVPARAPLKIDVIVKKRFNGKIRIYSTDPSVWTLLDLKNGEYLNSLEMEINTQPGKAGTITAGVARIGDYTEIGLGAEVLETSSEMDFRYHVRITTFEATMSPQCGDWYAGEGTENLFFLGDFASARAPLVLAANETAAYKALPQLTEWFAMGGEPHEKAERGLKAIIAAYGCSKAARLFANLLERNDKIYRSSGLDALTLCGAEARGVAENIKSLFEDEDPGVRAKAQAMYKGFGLEIPLKYNSAGNIPEKQLEQYREDLFAAYTFALQDAVSNPKVAINIIEDALEKTPNIKETAKLYLLLGQLKLKHAGVFKKLGGQNGTPPSEVSRHLSEYYYSEPGEAYHYNLYHFRKILSSFPDSDVADAAAYEMALNTPVTDSEGEWMMPDTVGPLSSFLLTYPKSKLADNAIIELNTALGNMMADIPDIDKAPREFNAEEFRYGLDLYEQSVEKLTPGQKAAAYEALGALREKLKDKDRAIKLYQYIVRNATYYKNIETVRTRLNALKRA